LRIIAIIGVISVHSGSHLPFPDVHPQTFIIFNIFNTLGTFGVNIFFLISGALILNKKETWQTFYQKRTIKIFIPFIFWSLIFFLTNQSQAHFWFLRIIIILYLLTPTLRVWLQQAQKKQILIFILLILFIVVISKPLALANYATLIADSMTDNSLFLLGLGLYVLGYYLTQHPLKIFSSKNLALIIISIFFITAVGTITLSYLTNNFFGYFQSHESITTITLALAIFTLVQKKAAFFQSLSPTLKKLINGTGGVAFGIYLIHLAVIAQISPLIWEKLPHITFFPLNLVVKIPLLIFGTFFISLAITTIIKKTPILKHLL
jgi:surface polysaccharide O-acyltransferase-like enzyme